MVVTVVIDDHCLSVVKTLPDLNPAQIAERLNRDEGLWLALWDGNHQLGKFYLYLTVGMNEESVISLCVPVCASIESILRALFILYISARYQG